MCPANDKTTQSAVQPATETQVGAHLNPHRHVPVVAADQQLVSDCVLVLAHGLILVPLPFTTKNTAKWIGSEWTEVTTTIGKQANMAHARGIGGVARAARLVVARQSC